MEKIFESFKDFMNEGVDLTKKAKAVIKHTDRKLVGWYKNVKIDYGVDGKGKTSYDPKTEEIVINYEENGKKDEFRMPYWYEESDLDYVYNVWMEQGGVNEALNSKEKTKIEDTIKRLEKNIDSWKGLGYKSKDEITDDIKKLKDKLAD